MTDDLISRAAAIAVAERAELDWADPSWTLEQLRALPAAQVQAEPENCGEIRPMRHACTCNEPWCQACAPCVSPPAPDDLDALVQAAQWARNRLEVIADEAWHGDARDMKRSIIGIFADFDDALLNCGSSIPDEIRRIPAAAITALRASEPSEYEKKVAQMKEDFPNGI